MSYVNGTIVIGFSDDFVGDKEAICKLMNQSNHWTEYENCMTYENDGIFVNSHDTNYPSLSNFRPTHNIVMEEGVERLIAVAEMTNEDWENFWDEGEACENHIVTEFAPDVSNHIQVGSMFMTHVSKEKQFHAYCEMLEVRANGSGSLTRISHSTNGSPEVETTNF